MEAESRTQAEIALDHDGALAAAIAGFRVREVQIAMQPGDEVAIGANPAPVVPAPGLELTVGRDDLVPPPFTDPPTAIHGARVPEADFVPTDGVAGTVHGMWYLGPFNVAAPALVPRGAEPV